MKIIYITQKLQLERLNKIKLARIVSDIFIPITFSAFISFYFPFLFTKNNSEFFYNFLLTFLSTVLFPLIYFLYKRKKGEIINRDAVIKEERNKVYLFSIVIFAFAYVISIFIKSPLFVQIYLLNFTLSTFGVLFINKRIKISVHSMSAAGTSSILLFVNPLFSMVLFLLTLFIMWSRVTLGVHSVREVIYGMIYGFCVTLFTTLMVLNYAT